MTITGAMMASNPPRNSFEDPNNPMTPTLGPPGTVPFYSTPYRNDLPAQIPAPTAPPAGGPISASPAMPDEYLPSASDIGVAAGSLIDGALLGLPSMGLKYLAPATSNAWEGARASSPTSSRLGDLIALALTFGGGAAAGGGAAVARNAADKGRRAAAVKDFEAVADVAAKEAAGAKSLLGPQGEAAKAAVEAAYSRGGGRAFAPGAFDELDAAAKGLTKGDIYVRRLMDEAGLREWTHLPAGTDTSRNAMVEAARGRLANMKPTPTAAELKLPDSLVTSPGLSSLALPAAGTGMALAGSSLGEDSDLGKLLKIAGAATVGGGLAYPAVRSAGARGVNAVMPSAVSAAKLDGARASLQGLQTGDAAAQRVASAGRNAQLVGKYAEEAAARSKIARTNIETEATRMKAAEEATRFVNARRKVEADAATAEAVRDEARRKAQVADAMSKGRDALARHRGLQEAAAADPALISIVLGNPGLGARARLLAFKEWAAASGQDVSGLNITMSHAAKAWARINREAGRK